MTSRWTRRDSQAPVIALKVDVDGRGIVQLSFLSAGSNLLHVHGQVNLYRHYNSPENSQTSITAMDI